MAKNVLRNHIIEINSATLENSESLLALKAKAPNVVRREDELLPSNDEHTLSFEMDPTTDLNDYSNREEYLKSKLEAFPNDAQSWYLLGNLLRMTKRPFEAENALRKAVSIKSESIKFWNELALLYIELGRVLDAAKIWYDHLRQTKLESDIKSGDSISAALQKTRSDNSMIHDGTTSNIMSPCVDCPHYTYYGCTEAGTCAKLAEWRSYIAHQY